MKEISDYYSNKIEQYGMTPEGVDWNSSESQKIRFDQLTKVISKGKSILDYGCGYGALCKYLNQKNIKVSYTGFDISALMILKAKEYAKNYNLKADFVQRLNEKKFDYLIASGIFSVRLNFTEDEWKKHIEAELLKMNEIARSGFSFNMLTKYSDKHLLKDNLYYADPMFWFDYCKRHFSRNVALLHDYDLYEFTIIVRKND